MLLLGILAIQNLYSKCNCNVKFFLNLFHGTRLDKKVDKMIQEDIRPIFIVGMNGSGTTMLADCLNNHPMIYMHKVESKVIPYYYKNIEKYGDMNNIKNFEKLLNEFSNNYAFRVCNNSIKLNIPFRFDEIKNKDLAKIIDLTFSYFSARENKIIWGDHSPKYAAFIPLLVELFPNAKILHIIRDGRDCAQSFKRRFGQNLSRTIFQWKKFVEKARKHGPAAGKDRYFEMKYEDLTRVPDLYMKEACSFLDVPFDDRVLISNMPMYTENDMDTTKPQVKTIVQNSGKWKEVLKKRQVKKLESIAGMTLKNIGYEVAYTEGDKDISKSWLSILSIFDKMNASIAYYKEYNEKDKLGTFIRSIRTSIKQYRSFK